MQTRAAPEVLARGIAELDVPRDALLPLGASRRHGALRRLQQQGQPVRALERHRRRRVGHRPDLDPAVLRRRDLPGELEGLVQVVRLEDVVAACHFGALGERAIGDARVVGTAADPHARRRRQQRVPTPDRGRGGGVEGLVGGHLGGLVGRFGGAVGLGGQQQCEVMHRVTSGQ